MSFSRVYPKYIAKAERKGRTKKEVDEIILWLTGYSQKEFEKLLEKETDRETFYTKLQANPSCKQAAGVILLHTGKGDQGSYHAEYPLSGRVN